MTKNPRMYRPCTLSPRILGPLSDMSNGNERYVTVCTYPYLTIFTALCKETMPKIRSTYSQKRNCLATSLMSYILVSVSDLYILTISLPILLQENRWTDHENI
jgi:hypothetical protein